MFIARERELKEIRESLSKSGYQGVFVYGRRRIGKTELINQGIANTKLPALSFEFRKRTLAGNLGLFTDSIRAFFEEPYMSFSSFDEAFDYLLKKSIEKEYVLVLDEFSFLLSEDFSIESSLAAAIDRYKAKSKIHLFVSGSYIGLMERMIGEGSHSYGRFNHVISLKPFDYYDSAKFYPDYTPEDKMMLYSVFGGIPFFGSLIDPEKPAMENILNLVVKTDSICEREIMETVMAETTKAPVLNELLLIILKGKTRYADINSVFSSQGLSKPDYYLDKLTDMGFIGKTYPITDGNNKKKIRYEIKDNLVDFYFRYLFNVRNRELRNNPEFFYDSFVKEDFLSKYLPRKFEKTAKEFLIRANIAKKIMPPFFEIGEYSINIEKLGLNRQFDIVTRDKKGFIAYECKHAESPIGEAVIREELYQASNLPDIKFYKLGFISKHGFEPGVDESKYNLFSLADFYDSSL